MRLSGSLVFGERRVVVHLQTLPVLLASLLLVLAVAATTALAAAAAACAAEAHDRCHHAVPRRQRVERLWQEVPVLQHLRQELWAVRLQDVDDHHKQDQHYDGHSHTDQHLPASDGQAEHGEWHDEEAQHQVDGGEPTVLGRVVAQALSQADGHTREGDGVPQEDPKDVEEEVTQGYLERGLDTTQFT